jgi:hypothetical protein
MSGMTGSTASSSDRTLSGAATAVGPRKAGDLGVPMAPSTDRASFQVGHKGAPAAEASIPTMKPMGYSIGVPKPDTAHAATPSPIAEPDDVEVPEKEEGSRSTTGSESEYETDSESLSAGSTILPDGEFMAGKRLMSINTLREKHKKTPSIISSMITPVPMLDEKEVDVEHRSLAAMSAAATGPLKEDSPRKSVEEEEEDEEEDGVLGIPIPDMPPAMQDPLRHQGSSGSSEETVQDDMESSDDSSSVAGWG